MDNVSLSLTLEHYDRHIPFFDGNVMPDGVDLTVLNMGQTAHGRHGGERHQRMLAGDFDAAELSFAS
jgi:hypothetical protein